MASGWYGGTSPSQMPWSPPAAAKKSRPKPAKEKRSEPREKRAESRPRQQKTLGPRLWRDTPSRSTAAAPRQTSAAQPKPAAPPKPKFDIIDFLSKKENWTKPVTQARQEEAAKTGKTPTSVGQFLAGDFEVNTPSAPQNMQQPLAANLTPEARAEASKPAAAPAKPKAVPTGTKPPPVSDGVRELLNDMNWKLPGAGKQTEMDKSSFEKGGESDLIEHDYRISDEEWDRILATYNTPEARAAGYIPPANVPQDVTKNMPLMHMQEEESAALTWDAYEKLSTDQKAAIDFNTLLTDARQKDLKKKITLSGADLTDYTKKVTELFGEGRGSDVIAPNTVGLLDQLDMQVVGQDLDEYLSLERAIDTKEIGDFSFSKDDVKTLETMATGGAPQAAPGSPSAPLATYEQVRTPENLAAIDTAGIQKAQQLIKTALQNPEAMTYDFDTLVYGPSQEMKGQPPMGFGDATTKWDEPWQADLNEWFQKGIQTLYTEDPVAAGLVPAGQDPMSFLLGDLDAGTGGDAKTRQEFIDYVANTANLLGQYGTKEQATVAAMVNKRAGLGG